MGESTQVLANIDEDARRLVEYHAQADTSVTKAYLFMDDSEIRLVELDATALPTWGDKEVTAFRFAADPQSGIHFPFAIAVILPEEFGTLRPPSGWGEWDSAKLIWEKP